MGENKNYDKEILQLYEIVKEFNKMGYHADLLISMNYIVKTEIKVYDKENSVFLTKENGWNWYKGSSEPLTENPWFESTIEEMIKKTIDLLNECIELEEMKD